MYLWHWRNPGIDYGIAQQDKLTEDLGKGLLRRALRADRLERLLELP
jgi:hypothetical protein